MEKKKSSDFIITKEYYEKFLKNKFFYNNTLGLCKITNLYYKTVKRNVGTIFKKKWEDVGIVTGIEFITIENGKIETYYYYRNKTNMYFLIQRLRKEAKKFDKIFYQYKKIKDAKETEGSKIQ